MFEFYKSDFYNPKEILLTLESQRETESANKTIAKNRNPKK